MNILNIDSTTRKMTITLSRKGEIISFISEKSYRKYMERIIGDVEKVLDKAGMVIGDIDALGINKGPGDFTGTRIGISVVKTLGWVLEVPVYGINALDVTAHSIAYSNKAVISKNISAGREVFVFPCLDVKKDELYFSLYRITDIENGGDTSGNIADLVQESRIYGIERIEDMQLVDAEDLPGWFDSWFTGTSSHKGSPVFIGGNAIAEYGEILSRITDKAPGIRFDRTNMYDHQGSLDACVRKSIEKGSCSQQVNPVYVRDFVPFGR